MPGSWERKGFIFYRSFYDQINMMPVEKQLDIYKAVVEYGLFGMEYTGNSNETKLVMYSAVPIIQANQRKYNGGKTGGAPEGNSNARKSLPASGSDGESLEPAFEKIWDLYPKKQGKLKAFDYFAKAIEDGEDVEKIRDGVERYANYVEADKIDPQYIKMGSTFFSQKAWLDDWIPKHKPPDPDDPLAEIFDMWKERIKS